MTVEELINELIEIEDKQKDVKLCIKINDDNSYQNDVVEVIDQQIKLVIYNW